jgi:uncharacterized membrane protein
LKRFLIAGLLVWVPVLVTIVIIKFLWGVVDQTAVFIPQSLQPKYIFGFDIPGFGIIVAFFILFLTGVFAANFIGRKIVSLSESIFQQIPFVRSIYKAVKQSLQVILSPTGNSFRQAVMVQYPRKGTWSLGFVTNSSKNDYYGIGIDEELLLVFIPTTPNPTSGYLLFIPRSEIKFLDVPVDEALRTVISLGTVIKETDEYPETKL